MLLNASISKEEQSSMFPIGAPVKHWPREQQLNEA